MSHANGPRIGRLIAVPIKQSRGDTCEWSDPNNRDTCDRPSEFAIVDKSAADLYTGHHQAPGLCRFHACTGHIAKAVLWLSKKVYPAIAFIPFILT